MMVPGRAPLRRLTRSEFNATVAALLGDSTHPADAFEPDVISDGFTNNADTQNVSTNLAQQYLTAAENLSAAAVQNLPKLLGCDPAAQDTCLRTFVTNFGQKAWRRPLASAEIDRVLGVLDAGRTQFDVPTGVQMALQTLLLSPNFLYRVEVGVAPASPASTAVALTSWEMAARLSYFLMGSMPDDQLFTAASRDELRTPAQVAAQVSRILAAGAATTLPQQQAQAHTAQFFTEWFHLNNIDRAQKDMTLYPEFTMDLGLAMRAETEAFVKATVFGGAGDLTSLLNAPVTYASADIAKIYGVAAPAGAAGMPARLDLDPKQRAGLLTQPALLATFAKANGTDPVHRGKFVWESLLCKSIPAPPANAKIVAPVITPGTTARQRYAQHRTDPTCASCHQVMDPIGLAFEHYDGIGRWRDKEGTLDIDASGSLSGTDIDGSFDGAVELAQKLAGSRDVAACAVRQMFRFAFGRYETTEDEPTIANLADRFMADKKQIVGLAVALTQTPAFLQLAVQH
ncbi:MAG TPA: DUF1592 domain-containing protein [Polyangia bacterium]|nr:DUF1592 domain-containing protein [Polyangia bacterium]